MNIKSNDVIGGLKIYLLIIGVILVLGSSCNLSRQLNISKESDRTRVEFDDAKLLFFGDYRFQKRKGQLSPAFPKALFSNLGIKGKVYGIGSTVIEPYFSIMIQKTDWQSLPDPNIFQNKVEAIGGVEFKAEPWTNYQGALMLSYQIPATEKHSQTYFCEQLFTYQESVYRLTFWTDKRPKNLYRESRAIFQTLAHP